MIRIRILEICIGRKPSVTGRKKGEEVGWFGVESRVYIPRKVLAWGAPTIGERPAVTGVCRGGSGLVVGVG